MPISSLEALPLVLTLVTILPRVLAMRGDPSLWGRLRL